MFDLSEHIRRFAVDVSSSIDDFAHINHQAVIYGLQASKPTRSGMYAKVIPLRFEKGKYVREYNGHFYRMPRVMYNGHEILYYIAVLLPRFLRLNADQKILTLLHELYHISPECNGDIRRICAGKPAHGASRREYDRRLTGYIPLIKQKISPDRLTWLEQDDHGLRGRFGEITGVRAKIPRPYLVEE